MEAFKIKTRMKDNGGFEGKMMKRKKMLSLLMMLAISFSVTGCTPSVPEEAAIILTEKEEEETVYAMATAAVADVELVDRVPCVYKQTREQEVCFGVSGKQVDRVYVEEGDIVEKGQLLASLDVGNADAEIERLEYQIARNNMLLDFLEENESDAISARWLQFLYRSGKSDSEKEAVEEYVSDLQQSNQYLREDYGDAIALDSMELEKIRSDIRQSSVYAELSGIVTSMKDNLEGSTSAKDEVIFKIIDNEECLFAVSETEYAPYFKEGMNVVMTITSGTGAGTYSLVPYDMENWSEELLFTIAPGYEDSSIGVGCKGNMYVVLDSRQQVLTIPADAVHDAEGKFYVYVIGENNMREIKWIEVGLCGDDAVEILSGLEEGEKVILK